MNGAILYPTESELEALAVGVFRSDILAYKRTYSEALLGNKYAVGILNSSMKLFAIEYLGKINETVLG